MMLVQPQGCAACEESTGNDLFGDIGKEFCAGMRVGIHEDQPVAGRRRRAGISCSCDLIDWLKNDGRSGCARNPRRAIGGIVVAHDQFDFPATLGKSAMPPI